MSVQTSVSQNMTAAFAGMVSSGRDADYLPMRNNEASAEIAFGRGVVFERSTDDDGALLPAAETDKPAGIVAHHHAYAKTTELGTTGLKPGAIMNVLRKGRIWVVCEDGCVPGDRLWMRAVAGGDPEFLGGLNNADDGTDMIDCTGQGVWLTTASAGGLAELEVDFTNA